ncbi:DNA-binding transcriptional response regulator, NtrC family, contains REC, AAA-type ATPase, and a Fis-type DNA-binding domains [Pseudomonas sp. ok272]|uniref:sigma-54 dependent transcriptional regulator n=1 Tax=unclassified Pseudomonas TaxID=196821 RepID=UPI0008B69D03|nr:MULTISPECIES: sigma-54 dependent transcriptional regulator [unclassified Pseudomonas]SEM63332.1 DNA-binding transcriptional response regulator, NtrC family, contains REC, AAA-type ATPase, and a Fis-type DNA-binding domains [Pseudomonas sp. ok272]SFM46656.1 DNA-binding transcriptional response regulator, NtrC family, contains REC, AAA-type ATPase, and a Fis-type DNA-binding domains [Pseudomonas sp. ok602]
MKSVNQSVDYTCTQLFADVLSQQKIVVVGDAREHSYALLTKGLQRQGCLVTRYASCTDLNATVLSEARLVFVFVSSVPAHALLAQVGAMMQGARAISVIPIVEYADQEKAAALLELGCVDYLLSPFSENQLSALLRRQESAQAAQEDFVSCSQGGRRLLAMAQRVAATRAPILITGETGTGKELMARYIHRFGASADAPFIAVNCAAIPEQMLESMLFGHERGAFTGAVSTQPGKFELANGGTLVLDEIGELPLGLQAKLLRVLQEQCVERLGGRKEIKLDVRIIAATNRDLQVEVAEGRFRADLMFRLDVLPLHITPLRERKDDVLPLARRFIHKYAPQEQHHNLLTDDACRALLSHDWPGNVRELENTVQRALVLRNGLFIQPQDLGLIAPATAQPVQVPLSPAMLFEGGGKAALRASGKWAEYQHVIDTIRKFDGHKTKAAHSLGMTPRALRYRLNAMREQGIQITI